MRANTLLATGLFWLGIHVFPSGAHADELPVAVAANFTLPFRQIGTEYEKATGHKLVASFGSTGKFYAQIRNGAPFQILLAADDETPAKLEKEGAIVPGSRFTYAVGRLVLWSPKADFVDDRGEVLKRTDIKTLAIANPRLAPYGQAAIETLVGLGLRAALEQRFVTAENVTQAQQFVASGNAELGFLPYSMVVKDGRIGEGSGWLVPSILHQPIRQDSVLLAAGTDKPAATAFLGFLKSESARRIIKSYGYDL